jgi:HAD superfamily hydrolase (TIGR01509 family)
MQKDTVRSFKAILFDAGNTLICREPTDDEVLLERVRRIGLEANIVETHRAIKQAELWTGIQTQCEVRGEPRMPDVEFFRGLDRAALQSLYPLASEEDLTEWMLRLERLPKVRRAWQLAPGARKTVETLRSMGLRMAVVSNFDGTLPGLFDQLGIAWFFETIVVSDQVGVVKPDPEILRIACRRMNIDASQALYIGDHPMDVLCANLAGMPVAWLREPGDCLPDFIGCQANFEIDDIGEILRPVKVEASTFDLKKGK